MPNPPQTKNGKLSNSARHVVLPSGIVSTGWPAVREKSTQLGMSFDAWQDGAGRAILAKREDGSYAASIGGVILSIPRQVGKTFLMAAIIFSLCILFPGQIVIWTAHRSRTADETFEAMKSLAKRKRIAPYIEKTLSGGGEGSIIFRNGSRILFGARESGFGRGFAKVTILMFDEAQILTTKAMEDMIPAANQGENALVLFAGTPPRPIDQGEVFKTRRRDALSGDDEDTLYIEFSADEDASLDDRKQWAKANPSYPKRTSETAILRMKKLLANDASFRREGLGIWDSDQEGSRAIAPFEWSSTGVSEAPVEGVRSFAVAFSFDGTRLALSGGLKHEDGIHVELIDAAEGDIASGLSALADWLAERWRNVAVIILSGASGAPVLAQLLKDRRVPDVVVKIVTTPEYTQSCSMTLDAVRESSAVAKRNAELEASDPLPFTHLVSDGQAQLDTSVGVCDKKNRGLSGAWAWYATTPDGDETPTESMSLAYWAAKTTRRKPRGDRERRAVFL